MQTDMGGYQPWQAGTSGSLKAYEPTWRDRLARVLMGEQKASPERARLVEGLTGSTGLGNSSLGLVDFVPGLGNAFQAQEEARKGEGANMMFAAVGGPPAKVSRAAAGAAGDVLTGGKLTPPAGVTAADIGKPREPNTPPLGAQREGLQSRLGVDDIPSVTKPSSQTVPAYVDAIKQQLEAQGLRLVGHDRSGLSSSNYLTFVKADGSPFNISKKGRSIWLSEFKAGAAPADGQFRVRVADHSNSGGATTPNADVRIGHSLDDVTARARRLLELEQQYPSGGFPSNQANALAPPPPGITAYHGSPHDFDRFDMSKIGTGEGAQAYGHGLYFAESEGVAKQYRDQNAFGKPTIPPMSREARSWLDKTMDEYKTNEMADGALQDTSELKSIVRQIYNPDREAGHPTNAIASELLDLIEAKKLRLEPDPGRMYEVRINADPADFLDWDKPLSAQSEKVRGAMNRLANGEILPDDTGEQALRSVAMQMGSRKFLEDPELGRRLSDAGVVGTKYLDQGSRTAGDGSRNYVVFRDDIIDIVKKYGFAFAASMYGMDQVQQVMLADQLQGPQQ
jgi:hypothetical protein